MRRGWMVAVAGMLLAAAGACGQSGNYHGAGLAQAGSIAYPLSSGSPGFVTLDVSVDASGAAQNVSVVRDFPPLTSVAQSAVQGWQYTPALVNGQAAAGTVRVNVVFNPYNPSGVGLPGASLQAATGGASGDFQPAQLNAASYATYPPNTVTAGTVVLQVHVGSSGNVKGVVVVKGVGSLSGTARKAVKTWQFAPATYQGKAVASDVVVAFVFASPEAGTR